MTIGISLGKRLLVAHVGDSRAYLQRQGRLLQLTRDHTFAQSLAEAGVIPVAEAARHRLRHLLTRGLGSAESADAEFHQLTLQDGDRLLLCTDGLTELVKDEAINEILLRHIAPQDACRALVDRALFEGGTDNVTVVLVCYEIGKRRHWKNSCPPAAFHFAHSCKHLVSRLKSPAKCFAGPKSVGGVKVFLAFFWVSI